eukprot:scaffold114601_cov72-Phaeocystis_antarctica.AAC.1
MDLVCWARAAVATGARARAERPTRAGLAAAVAAGGSAVQHWRSRAARQSSGAAASGARVSPSAAAHAARPRDGATPRSAASRSARQRGHSHRSSASASVARCCISFCRARAARAARSRQRCSACHHAASSPRRLAAASCHVAATRSIVFSQHSRARTYAHHAASVRRARDSRDTRRGPACSAPHRPAHTANPWAAARRACRCATVAHTSARCCSCEHAHRHAASRDAMRPSPSARRTQRRRRSAALSSAHRRSAASCDAAPECTRAAALVAMAATAEAAAARQCPRARSPRRRLPTSDLATAAASSWEGRTAARRHRSSAATRGLVVWRHRASACAASTWLASAVARTAASTASCSRAHLPRVEVAIGVRGGG